MFNKKKQKEEIQASSIQKIEEAAFPIVPFKFNGSTVLCRVRCLNGVQLKAIGEFNLIDIEQIADNKEYSLQDLIDTRNWQEALIKETLIAPTFTEIQDKIYGKDNRITDLKKRANKVRGLIAKIEDEKQKKDLEKEVDTIELYIGSLLPDDFMNAVTSWATGTDRSDIKKLTRKMLLKAAILARNGQDNPANHIKGDFLDFHKDEINESAWIVYNEYQKEKALEKEHNKVFGKNARVIRGGKVRV